jgi:outer membrane receptor protein involved in Fe transport
MPVNFADGSGDFYQIDPIYFRSIEVFKGGNALIFGTSTLGGAVNFVSPTGYTALVPDIVRVDGGSFGTIRGQVRVSHNELLQFTTNANVPATTFNAPNSLHQGIEFAGSIDLLRDSFGPGSDDVLTLSQVWPGYVLLSLQAGVDLPQGMSLYVDARNLTNQNYASDISTITNANQVSTMIFYPGNGRSVFGGLRWQF